MGNGPPGGTVGLYFCPVESCLGTGYGYVAGNDTISRSECLRAKAGPGRFTLYQGERYRQLRARRALSIFMEVLLRTRRVPWLYNGTTLNSHSALLALN